MLQSPRLLPLCGAASSAQASTSSVWLDPQPLGRSPHPLTPPCLSLHEAFSPGVQGREFSTSLGSAVFI